MSVTKITTFNISEKPGPMGLVVETVPFTIHSSAVGWRAEHDVVYADNTVNVIIAFNGQMGQPYAMTITINDVTKPIEGVLQKNGHQTVYQNIPSTNFNF